MNEAKPSNDTNSNSGLKWRIGLLVITALMGASLINSGIDRYQAALKSFDAIAEAQVFSILMSAKRELDRPMSATEQVLSELFEDLSGRGVNYLALMGTDGKVICSRGEAKEAMRMPQESFLGPPPNPHMMSFVRSGVVHGFMGVGRPFRQGRMGAKSERARQHRPEKVVVVELSPTDALGIVSSARIALYLEMGAALFLLAAGAVFWRMSRRAEKLYSEMEQQKLETERQLERDRQLKALGEMSAVLGHEIRNPLAALKGHAQLLLEAMDVGHPSREKALRVVENAVQLETLTQQVLDFARTGELDLTNVYLDDLVHAATTFAQLDKVETRLPEEPVQWLLDRNRMEQVLVNLLKNAAQASLDDDPIFIDVDASESLKIVITDNGPGIRPGDEERVFQPFFTSRAKGTGLGLALARKIVEAHGGTITAANGLGRGAVFTIVLPGSKSLSEAK